MSIDSRFARPLAILTAVALCGAALLAQLQYPQTPKGDHVDTYHDTKVPDPYRWLEDDTSGETKAWVEAQNKVTFPYLEKIPFRAQLHARVKELNNYERYTAPFQKGPYVFFRKNEGLQNQSVLYIQKGLTGAPEVLIDPNQWGETVGADGVRAVEGCEICRLRRIPERLGLAAVQGNGARDEEDAV